MRGKIYVGALTAFDGYLLVNKLRYSEEVLPSRALPAPAGQRWMRRSCEWPNNWWLHSMASSIPRNTAMIYRERLLNYIEAKAKGKRPRLPDVKERSVGGSLDVQLARSLAALKRGPEKKVA